LRNLNAFRALHLVLRVKVAVIAGVLAATLLGGFAFAFWPGLTGSDWHNGPVAKDLEAEVAPEVYAAAPNDLLVPAAVEAEATPATIARQLTVARGDTLMGLLVGAGVSRSEAHGAISALREVFSPRDLKPGQTIRIDLAAQMAAEDSGRLLSLSLRPSVEQDVRVTRGDDGFVAEAVERKLAQRSVDVSGRIDSNLSVAAHDAGVPVSVMVELIRIFSFDVDFQRDLQPGDGFEVMYNARFEADGTLAKTDEVLYASMTLSGKRIDLYRFNPKSGFEDYFDLNGQSVRKTLMRTPIDGARLSSGFGKRKHPILGYTKMHRGVDFAAPRGTPIYAAGDGVVEVAGRNGGYGNYVRIRHNSTYSTAYAHMWHFAKSIRRGARVRQGQVIGYVGTTGRSTGPHLHYEVLVNHKQVNPMNVKLPSGEKLAGADLKAFQRRRAEIDLLRMGEPNDTMIVKAE